MTKEEIFRIKEHIEIHARREPHAVKITEIMWKVVDELEHIAELKEQIEKMKCCENCKHFDFDEPKYCHKGVYNCAYVCGKWELGN